MGASERVNQSVYYPSFQPAANDFNIGQYSGSGNWNTELFPYDPSGADRNGTAGVTGGFGSNNPQNSQDFNLQVDRNRN